MGLHVHPELCRCTEVTSQAKSSIGRDATPLIHDLRDARGRDPKFER
jgi:hypothetical protein